MTMLNQASLYEAVRDLCDRLAEDSEEIITDEDVEGALARMDFGDLLQVVRHKMGPAYAYTVRGKTSQDLHYCGPDLFGQNGVRLFSQCLWNRSDTEGRAARCVELWMGEDLTFIPVSCVSMSFLNGYRTEYRVVRQCEPWEGDSGLDLDLNVLLTALYKLSRAGEQHDMPYYEL